MSERTAQELNTLAILLDGRVFSNGRLYIERPELSHMSCRGCAFVGRLGYAPHDSESEIYKLCVESGECGHNTIWIEVP